jgi:MFS family permease
VTPVAADTGLAAYRGVLRHGGVRPLLAAATLSRLGTAMLAPALLLGIAAQTGVGEAGVALGGHALALAVCAPFGGRLVDRRGVAPVVVRYVIAHAMAYAALVVAVARGASAPAVVVAAMLVGATVPPAAAATRARWPRLLPEQRLSSAYALDSALNSGAFVIGPLLAGLGVTLLAPAVLLAVAGAARIGGDLLLAATARRDTAPPGSPPARRRLGALRDRPARRLLTIASLDTCTYGVLQVGAVAATPRHTAAVLLALLAAGELTGGIAYGAVRQGSVGPRLAALHLGTLGPLAILAADGATGLLAAAYLTAGLLGGARDALNGLALGAAVPGASKAEAFGWLATFMWGGYSGGTAIAGALRGPAGPVGLGVAGAAGVLIAVVLAIRLGRDQRLRVGLLAQRPNQA